MVLVCERYGVTAWFLIVERWMGFPFSCFSILDETFLGKIGGVGVDAFVRPWIIIGFQGGEQVLDCFSVLFLCQKSLSWLVVGDEGGLGVGWYGGSGTEKRRWVELFQGFDLSLGE